ncbi:MAG: hypothetical protein Q4D58_02985 [Synergistaceae bacterium]|nr:hypothetical protein [Synergistaceae bacterium]
MPFGEIMLLSVMGITAAVSTVFSIYMLKVTMWDAPDDTKKTAAETVRAGC